MLLIDYQSDSTNYRLFNHETKSVVISKNVIFNEKIKTSSEKKKQERNNLKVSFPADDVEDDHIVELPEEDESNEKFSDAQSKSKMQTDRKKLPTDQQSVESPQVLRDRFSIRPPNRYELNIIEYNRLSDY